MEKEQIKSTPLLKNRLDSLDALRGFDMFWIVGGEGIFHALAALTGWSFFIWISGQLEHVKWNGFHFYDMIFPLFLFIAGISMPFSLTKRLERGDSRRKVYGHIIKRMLILVFLGMVYNGLLEFNWEHMRYASVLARIGMGWFFAALIFMNSTRKTQYYWFGGILIVYWLVLNFIPVPGHGMGDLSQGNNLADYIDQLFLPGRLYLGNHDPEGILSTFPAIATALFGVLTGHFLKDQDPKYTPLKKAIFLAGAGMGSLILAYLWNFIFPINKNLWTSTFVLFAGGWSLVLLSVFYLVIDVWKIKKWSFFFVVIGMNPIVIYLCQKGIIAFKSTSDFFLGGFINHYIPENWHDLMNSVGYVAAGWVFLYLLYKQKIFVKI